MIVEATNASHGVGYEIAYAEFVHHLPILLLTRNATGKVSAMLNERFEVFHYDDESTLQLVITRWLDGLTRRR
jgi:hypothetical protein